MAMLFLHVSHIFVLARKKSFWFRLFVWCGLCSRSNTETKESATIKKLRGSKNMLVINSPSKNDSFVNLLQNRECTTFINDIKQQVIIKKIKMKCNILFQNDIPWYTERYTMVYRMIHYGIPNYTLWYTERYNAEYLTIHRNIPNDKPWFSLTILIFPNDRFNRGILDK